MSNCFLYNLSQWNDLIRAHFQPLVVGTNDNHMRLMSDVIKQNELEIANTDFKKKPSKAESFFVSYCF